MTIVLLLSNSVSALDNLQAKDPDCLPWDSSSEKSLGHTFNTSFHIAFPFHLWLLIPSHKLTQFALHCLAPWLLDFIWVWTNSDHPHIDASHPDPLPRPVPSCESSLSQGSVTTRIFHGPSNFFHCTVHSLYSYPLSESFSFLKDYSYSQIPVVSRLQLCSALNIHFVLFWCWQLPSPCLA